MNEHASKTAFGSLPMHDRGLHRCRCRGSLPCGINIEYIATEAVAAAATASVAAAAMDWQLVHACALSRLELWERDILKSE